MQCEEVCQQFTDYLAGGAQKPLLEEVAHHLESCESCRASTEEMQKVWESLASIPTSPPGPETSRRFHLMLEAYEQGLEQSSRPGLWHGMNAWLDQWWPRQPVLQFALTLAVLVAGVFAGQVLRTTPLSPVEGDPEIAELRGQLSEMRQMVALSLMQQQGSASDRLRGVNWSYQLPQPSQEVLAALLDTLMRDPNVNVRLATVDALRQFGDQPAVRSGVVEAMAKQESPMVQVALIDLAVDLHAKDSVATLRKFTQDQNLDAAVRDRAKNGLAQLE